MFLWAKRSQRDSEVYPSKAWITVNGTNSASVNFGAIPTRGRHGANSGDALSRSSALT